MFIRIDRITSILHRFRRIITFRVYNELNVTVLDNLFYGMVGEVSGYNCKVLFAAAWCFLKMIDCFVIMVFLLLPKSSSTPRPDPKIKKEKGGGSCSAKLFSRAYADIFVLSSKSPDSWDGFFGVNGIFICMKMRIFYRRWASFSVFSNMDVVAKKSMNKKKKFYRRSS